MNITYAHIYNIIILLDNLDNLALRISFAACLSGVTVYSFCWCNWLLN